MKKESIKCACCKLYNTFPVKKRLEWNEEKNPLFTLFPSKEEMHDDINNLQTCVHCGYTFIRLDEDVSASVKKWMLKTKEFRVKDVPEDIAKAHQVAMVMQALGAERFATKWNLYCAVLLDDIGEKERARNYYKKCFVLMDNLYNSCYRKKNDFLLLLNIMRLAGMYSTVVSMGNHEKYSFSGIERRLIEMIINLAREEKNDYITFYDMLLE